MTDMTNNRVQYSLLTDEEKAALEDHQKVGGGFEYLHTQLGWINVNPDWHFNVVYRTVPLPKTQDVIAWEKLPKRFQWVAREKDKEVCAYEYEPYELGWWTFDEGDVIRIDDFPGIVQIGTVDWKDSKQQRPK